MRTLTQTDSDLRVLRERLEAAPQFGFDTETSSEHPHPAAMKHWDKLFMAGCSFGFPDGHKTYVPVRHSEGNVEDMAGFLDLLAKVMADKSKKVWAHNWKFDLIPLDVLGIDPQVEILDSMILVWLLFKGLGGDRGHKLKPLVLHYLKHKMKEFPLAPGVRMHQVPAKAVGDYAADDALQCLRLAEHFWPELMRLELEVPFRELEMPFVRVLRHMEDVGCGFDTEYTMGLYHQFAQQMRPLEKEWVDLVGCDIGSSQQCSILLYDKLKWWPSAGLARGKSGHYSVDKAHVAEMFARTEAGSPGRRACELKREHSQLSKLTSTFTASLVQKTEHWDDRRLRSNLKQHGTETGRLSSSDPNLQQIPIRTANGRLIRGAFIAEQGWHLGDVDQSQFELRIMAHLSQDPMLMKAYTDDIDVHQQTADTCKCSRDAGKVTNLGLIYEMSGSTLAGNLGIPDDDGWNIWRAWHDTYSRVKPYHNRQHAYARKHGFIRTVTGRIRPIPEIESGNGARRSYAQRTASNSPCQGSAADIIKIGMRNLYRRWKEKGVLYDARRKTGTAKICLQIHDEVLYEAKDGFQDEAKRDVEECLEGAVKLRVPLKAVARYGRSWLEAH